MKEYKVSYRISNKAQTEGREPWSDVKNTEIVEADNGQEAIIFLMDLLSDSARNNGYNVETEEEKQEIKVFDNEELMEIYDFFEIADETDIHTKPRKTKTSAEVKNRYNKKTYDTIIICPKKGEKEKIKAIAEKNGESMNAYILRLINEDANKNTIV